MRLDIAKKARGREATRGTMFLLSRHLSLGRTWCARVSFALLSGFITGAKQGDGQAQREREREKGRVSEFIDEKLLRF